MSAHADIVVIIDEQGNAECLWTEQIDLAALGALDIHRASEIEFNNRTGQWEVRLTTEPDHVVYSNPSRIRCLAWEHDEINRQLMEAKR